MHKTLERISRQQFNSFFLISGPCAVESYETCREVAIEMKRICDQHDIPYIFKGSYKKANRTSGSSFQGIGDVEALEILGRIGRELDLAVTTDVHEVKDVELVSEVVDLIQIPAFLCRQTELLKAAGASGLPVNIKKGQFMSGAAMQHAQDKAKTTEEQLVILTERGNSFGYGDLVVDARNVNVMTQMGPVVMDCTHATQRPNQIAGITGGNPAEIELFARLGLVSGAQGLFIEVHPNPSAALSDGASMLHLAEAEALISRLQQLSIAHKSIYA